MKAAGYAGPTSACIPQQSTLRTCPWITCSPHYSHPLQVFRSSGDSRNHYKNCMVFMTHKRAAMHVFAGKYHMYWESSQLKSSDSHLWDSTHVQGHNQTASCVCLGRSLQRHLLDRQPVDSFCWQELHPAPVMTSGHP